MYESGGCFPTTRLYIWPTDFRLTWVEAIGKGGPWGSEILPLASQMAVWYQLEPSPAPAPLGGWSVGPPKVAGVALWWGANNFLHRLEALGLPLWLVVGTILPWFKAGLDPPPWGVGCPGGPVAAFRAWVPAEGGLAGRGRPLGRDFGAFCIGSSWSRGM